MKALSLEPLPGLHPTLAVLAASLENETAEWRSELEDVDEDTLVWQPVPRGHLIGALLLHIADVEAYWITEVAAGKQRPAGEAERLLSEETQQYNFDWPTPPRRPLNWYLGQLDEIRARTLEDIKGLDPDKVISRGSRASVTPAWCVSHVIGHESYHAGQAVLLKLLRQGLGSV